MGDYKSKIDKRVISSFEKAIENITAFHKKQFPQNYNHLINMLIKNKTVTITSMFNENMYIWNYNLNIFVCRKLKFYLLQYDIIRFSFF